MLNNEKESIPTIDEKIDVEDFLKMILKLPEKEKKAFFYMMKGAELVKEKQGRA